MLSACCPEHLDHTYPVLQFQAELRAQQAEGTTRVHKVSHVGGHKYAGLVLIYGPAVLDWYAYVRPSDVPDLVKEVWDIFNLNLKCGCSEGGY